ncbi:hypothetical protein Q7O_001881 [Pectobacterium carotovorum subsp. carotovorum PCCS1]|nr:hypothetical protein [Pectobacterium carotovorum subsp. carotovorum PCCS1]
MPSGSVSQAMGFLFARTTPCNIRLKICSAIYLSCVETIPVFRYRKRVLFDKYQLFPS